MNMTEFDKKLNNELHKYKAETRMSFKDIADNANIVPSRLYRFTSELQALNAEDTHKLMQYLKLTVNLEKK